MIAYYAIKNINGNYYPSLIGLSYFALAKIIYYTSEFMFVCICHTHNLGWKSITSSQLFSHSFGNRLFNQSEH